MTSQQQKDWIASKDFFCFDAYGTLLDVHSALTKKSAQLGEKADAISILWRIKQLEYSWVYTLNGRYLNFWQLTKDALEYALDFYKVEKTFQLQKDLQDAYWRLDCYDEVKSVLSHLKKLHKKLCIFSNGTPSMIESAIESNDLANLNIQIISLDPLKCYKTQPKTYQYMLDQLNAKHEQCLFFSSNRWDIAGANSFGLETIWINR
ncbi:MAG: haloacid dehalogenase type II, partial [Pseudomonadota bacterium]